MEIGRGKLKGLLRDAFIEGGRYYIQATTDSDIGKHIGRALNFDEWYMKCELDNKNKG